MKTRRTIREEFSEQYYREMQYQQGFTEGMIHAKGMLEELLEKRGKK